MGWTRGGAVVAGLLGAVALATSANAAVPPPPNLTWGGDVSDQGLMVVEVNAAGTRVKSLHNWASQCTLGPAGVPGTTSTTTSWVSGFSDIPVNRAGAWRKTWTTTQTDGPLTRRFRHAVTGRRAGDRMVGNFNSRMTETDASGAVVRTCVGGSKAFRLPGRHVFAGETVQRELIVITTNPARTRVTRIRWDWQSSCALGPAAKPDTGTTLFFPDAVGGPFRIAPNGAWGDDLTFDPRPDPATGISTGFQYAMRGRIIGQRMRGSILSTLTEIDTASGGQIRTCRNASAVKFTIRD